MNVFRLHTNNFNGRVNRFNCHRNTRNQTTTTNWHNHVIDIVQIFQNFQTNSALTSNNFRVIIWWNKDTAFRFHNLANLSDGVVEVVAMQHNFRGIIAGCRYFRLRCAFRHHHFAVDTEHGAGERNPLRMVTCRASHHALHSFCFC